MDSKRCMPQELCGFSLWRVFISPSSSCSLATLDTFQASFWPWVCFSPFLTCFHNPIIKSQNKCGLDMRCGTSANVAFRMPYLEIPAIWYWEKESRLFTCLMRRIIQDFAFNTKTQGSYFWIRKEVNISLAEFFFQWERQRANTEGVWGCIVFPAAS